VGLNKDFVAVDPEFLTEENRQDFRAQLLSNLPLHAELVYLVDLYYAQAVSNVVALQANSSDPAFRHGCKSTTTGCEAIH
jgi:hypothetical protein